MTASRASLRKPGSLRGFAGRHGDRFRRLRAVDHPGRSVTVRADPEPMCPEGLLYRHGDTPAVGEAVEETFGFLGLRGVGHEIEALRLGIAIARHVAAEQALIAEVDA